MTVENSIDLLEILSCLTVEVVLYKRSNHNIFNF